MADDRYALVVFEVGERRCAVPAGSVREVVHYAELAKPPGMPRILEGFLNYAGDILPVVRLETLFGLDSQPPGLYSPMLVLRPACGRLALLVDVVRSVVSVSPDDLRPVDDTAAFNGCVEAELRLGDETIHLLVPERILLEQERRRLYELQDMVDTRLAALEAQA